MRVDPTHYIWWLVSRAAGIVALGLISLSVLIGLTMATKILRRPGLPRKLARLHEHVALVALAAIAVHGVSLLGDSWLRIGIRGLIVPFTMGYRPLFTGLGIVAAYLAALLGLSFYVRRTIGTRVWRKLHRATVLVWVLGVAHTLGSGSDASTVWLRMMMLVMGAPIVFLALLRILQSGSPKAGRVTPGTARPEARSDVGAPIDPAASSLQRPGHRHDGREALDHSRRARPRPAIVEEVT